MKTRIFLIISLSIIILSGLSRAGNANDNRINLAGGPELKELAGTLVKAYQEQNPGVNIYFTTISSLGELTGENGLALVYGEEDLAQASWKMTLAREIIVPVFNSENPYTGILNEQGVTKEKIQGVFGGSASMNWSSLIGNGQNNPMHIYILNEPATEKGVAKFLNSDNLKGKTILVENAEKFYQAVTSDPLALGFCNLSAVSNAEGTAFMNNIKLLPIDKNSNGKLDYMENIYNDPESLLRGVWIGKYQDELTLQLHAVASEKPSDPQAIAFLAWMLTSGQSELSQFGFNGLVNSEVQSKLDRIVLTAESPEEAARVVSIPRLILFIVAGIALLGIVISAFFGLGRKEKEEMVREQAEMVTSFNEKTVNAPAGLYYDKNHSWAFMEQDGSVKVGLDDFIQHITGPVTRVEMKKAGEKVKKGEAFLTLVQKGKKLIMYAPVSGTILETNKSLSADPSTLYYSPYNNGWIYRIEPASWLAEIPLLNMADKYSKWLSGEFTRLKDFLAMSLQARQPELAHVVLQDGGELLNNLLEDFGPEFWEDFQAKFIDSNK